MLSHGEEQVQFQVHLALKGYFAGMNFLFLHICEITLYLKVCLATATDKLFDPTTCLLHKNKGIPLSDLPKNTTNEFAGFFTFPFLAQSVKREVANNFFKVFDTTRQWN